MHLKKSSNGHELVLSRKEWEAIGKKAGWDDDSSLEALQALQPYMQMSGEEIYALGSEKWEEIKRMINTAYNLAEDSKVRRFIKDFEEGGFRDAYNRFSEDGIFAPIEGEHFNYR